MKQGRTLVGLVEELERQLNTKVDMIVPTPLMHHVTGEDGHTSLLIEAPDGSKRFTATENCRRQLADRLKIPFAYFERMRTDQAELLDRNVNTWLHKEPEQRLVRTGEMNDGRSEATALGIGDEHGETGVHDAHEGIGGTEINADNFAHHPQISREIGRVSKQGRLP